MLNSHWLRGGLVVLTLSVAGPFLETSRAAMVLTQAAIDQGLGVSTFVDNFPSFNGVGPLGIAFPATGGVLVSDWFGNVRRFATDSDGQNAALAPIGQNYGQNNNANALVRVGGSIYMSQYNQGGRVLQINDDGTFNQVIVSGVPQALGMAVNPADGHLFVASGSNNQILDVDPVAKTMTVFAHVSRPDGISISPDGKTLYAAAYGTGHIVGFDVLTGAQVFDSGYIGSGVDGTAAGSGAFSNLLFANLNNGKLIEIDLTTHAQTVIGIGGSRGDFVTVDPSNNTLLITQSDRILRLTGASFTAVPEPGSLVLMGLGSLLTLGLFRRRAAGR